MTESTVDNIDRRHETSEPRPQHSLRTYYVIFAWLMGLLVLTVIASLIPFDRLAPGLNVLVALVIAVVKGALVVLFFMHVKDASKVTWAFASAAFLWLMILLALTFNDYLTRGSLPGSPSDQPPAPAHNIPTQEARHSHND